jgi:hypothetical protein
MVIAVCSALLLVACGRGQDPTVDGPAGVAAATSTTSTTVVEAATTTTATATDSTAPTADPGVSVAPTTEPPTTVAPGTGVPVDDVPAEAFGPPAAGRYRFHTTGSSNNQPVDMTGDTVIERLSDTDVRQTSADGSQTTVLRYVTDRVDLVTLDATLAGQSRHFDGPVLFSPIPPAGQWSWDLRSSDGRTTAHQDSRFVGRETITTPGGTFDTYRVDSTVTIVEGSITATIQLQTWVDIGLRTSVRIHQTTSVPLLLQADTTSEYLGFSEA